MISVEKYRHQRRHPRSFAPENNILRHGFYVILGVYFLAVWLIREGKRSGNGFCLHDAATNNYLPVYSDSKPPRLVLPRLTRGDERGIGESLHHLQIRTMAARHKHHRVAPLLEEGDGAVVETFLD